MTEPIDGLIVAQEKCAKLGEIATAAKKLVRWARRNFPLYDFAYDGPDDLIELLDPAVLIYEILECFDKVERLVNPRRLPFGERERHNLWQIAGNLVLLRPALLAALADLFQCYDKVLQDCGVEDFMCVAGIREASWSYLSSLWSYQGAMPEPDPSHLDDLDRAGDCLLAMLDEEHYQIRPVEPNGWHAVETSPTVREPQAPPDPPTAGEANEVNPGEQNGGLPQPGYLDIVLDKRNFRVIRGQATADFGGNEKPWKVFVKIHSYGESICPLTDLRNVWPDHSVAPGTVCWAVSAARAYVRELKITIKNKRNLGYTVKELPGT